MRHGQNQEPTPDIPLEQQARHFAEKHAAQAGTGMLKTITGIQKRAKVLTWIALAASMPHQVSYLVSLCLPHLSFDWSHAIESIGMLLIAVAFPVASDLIIVNCIETISTTVASDASRWRAVAAILAPVGFSGWVNFAAPGPQLIKVLSAGLVGYIVVSEILKFVKPDFRKLNIAVTEPVAGVATGQEPVTRRRSRNRKDRVLQILAENPHMRAVEVAKRSGVSANYVYTLKREAKKVEVDA